MIYKLELSNTFKKSFKKLKEKEKLMFQEVAIKLSNNQTLEPKYKDHQLKGALKDFRECHIKPDLLLIYQKQDDKLILYCLEIGSHSELFKK